MNIEQRETALRDALRDFAHGKGPSGQDLLVGNTAFTAESCDWVFNRAGIDIPEDKADAVRIAFRRMPFHGGNFTLDARRLLAALGGEE